VFNPADANPRVCVKGTQAKIGIGAESAAVFGELSQVYIAPKAKLEILGRRRRIKRFD
jgi:hypothetical protein